MKPIYTHHTNATYTLPGGNESNNLPINKTVSADGKKILISTWQLDDSERELISKKGVIELIIWGEGHPPVALAVVDFVEDQLHYLVKD